MAIFFLLYSLFIVSLLSLDKKNIEPLTKPNKMYSLIIITSSRNMIYYNTIYDEMAHSLKNTKRISYVTDRSHYTC